MTSISLAVRHYTKFLVRAAVFREPDEFCTLHHGTTLYIQYHPCSTANGKVIIEVPFLISSSMTLKRDDWSSMSSSGDVECKSEKIKQNAIV